MTRWLTAGVALAPAVALGALILVPFLQWLSRPRPSGAKAMLMSFILERLTEPPILHPGRLGILVLAACLLLAEAPIAVALVARSHHKLKLGAATGLVGLLWLGAVMWQAWERSQLGFAAERVMGPTDQSLYSRFITSEWLSSLGPDHLVLLLPIGLGGAWVLHAIRPKA
ncbi:MAG TPA: hypothetical protein VND93_33445 [Myxococcales bacterium]|nr:hypothetical protein [Myxococcales bacterium]